MKFDEAIGGLRSLPAWGHFALTPDGAKFKKMPVGSNGIHSFDMTYDQAVITLQPGHALGFRFDAGCGYFLLDLDHVREGDNWSAEAKALCARFPGAFVEVSSSCTGLHVIGRLAGPVPRHSTRSAVGELYTQARGIAFGLSGQAVGNADTLCDVAFAQLVADHFQPRRLPTLPGTGTGARRAEWRGPEDDDVLIERMLRAKPSAAAAFGTRATLRALWEGTTDQNSEHDAALAQHLAFWTGCDAPRIERMMRRSGLRRAKWDDHHSYLSGTIAKACALQERVYVEKPATQLVFQSDSQHDPVSELGNAQRLCQLADDRLMFVQGLGWHAWDAGPWVQDDHVVALFSYKLGAVIRAEADALNAWVAEAVGDKQERERREKVQKARYAWARVSENRATINNTLALAEPYFSQPAEAIDAKPLLIGLRNGVYNLASGVFREHARDDLLTKVASVDFHADARSPLWDGFVHRIMGARPEMVRYLRQLAGYMLSGVRTQHILPIAFGSGANGKSTFLGALQALMGDYAGVAAPGLLIANPLQQHPTGVASLHGKRLVVASETGEGARLNEDLVKQLTGGDKLTARLMRGDFFEFVPTHLLFLQTNHRPRIRGNDDGIWRRLKLVPFTQTIPANERDASLPEKLLGELPGILNWCLDGWADYHAHGFVEPADVALATSEYRTDSDHVGTFIDERCVIDGISAVPAAFLYSAYKAWCTEAGEHALSQRTLGQRLAERPENFQSIKGTAGARFWRGLKIIHAGA
ncbi:phage/plasmid primase, P4 family [Xanthomonas sp. 3058]|uniref:phage/plasmid primase, P4 family n=1 Tax=Xanthomonas sp. 3058 TaxID=3035314 RepID=UPI00161535CC|nr:phage/plasmid primase, P4 family [Xanthomonas sp. 3058]MBB5866197.1 P4 family phage/plasmid primase-like protein [Xanthomonas sp. 3058]